MLLTPYDKLPRLQQVYLWFRYMPIAYLLGVISLSFWLLRGAPTILPPPEAKDWPPEIVRRHFGRRATARLAYQSWIGLAHMRMGHTYTLAEIIADYQERVHGKA